VGFEASYQRLDLAQTVEELPTRRPDSTRVAVIVYFLPRVEEISPFVPFKDLCFKLISEFSNSRMLLSCIRSFNGENFTTNSFSPTATSLALKKVTFFLSTSDPVILEPFNFTITGVPV